MHDDRRMTLDDVIASVAARVPFLDAYRTAEGDDWVGGAALTGDPETVARVVQETKPGFGTDDDVVAASLFTEAYAFRLAGTALAAYALDLPVPDVAPAATAVRVDKPRPTAVAYLDDRVRTLDAEALARELVDGHLAPFVDAVHGRFPVGQRLLWADVADAAAVAFRAVESSGADRARVRDRAEAFFAACGPTLAGVGAFTVVEHDGREGWYWDRTSCCLWLRTTGSQLCDNCNLIDRAELRERRVRELGSGS